MLWSQMSRDGVRDLVYVMYVGPDNTDNNTNLARVCDAVPPSARCHLLNTDTLITSAYMRSDGIHPSDEGYDRIGRAVFTLMVEKGMRR